MRLLTRVLTIAAWLTLILSACAEQHTTPSVEPAKTSIASVRGDPCPVYEEQLVKSPDKAIFTSCDLQQTPEMFDGKLVRISSTYRFMIHGAYLSEGECGELPRDVHNAVAVGFENKSDHDYLTGYRNPVEVVAIGKFSLVVPKKESDTIYANSPFQFNLICLEKASLTPPNDR